MQTWVRRRRTYGPAPQECELRKSRFNCKGRIHMRIYLSVLTTCAVVTALTACTTPRKTDAPAPKPKSSARAVSEPKNSVPIPKAAPEGIDYSMLSRLLEGPVKLVHQDIVGKQVTLDLSKAQGRNVPVDTYIADTDHAAFFQCKTSRPGFTGGQVTAKITNYIYLAKSRQKIVELDHCAPTATETVPPEPNAPAATTRGQVSSARR
jgi:hypothetical protein